MTANSIIFYRKIYPHAQIILSTWDDEPKEQLEKIAKLGAIIVASSKPENPGVMNVNLQLTNSLAGIRKASELGCEFVVKTRTDQRVCKPYIFDTMISCIHKFPGQGEQKGRIVALGVCGGGMFIPYHTCDFLYLGYTEDLVRLFSSPHDKREQAIMQQFQNGKYSRRENSQQMFPPEIYIMKHYCIDVLGLSGEDTVKEYWSVVKNHLILFGMNDVGLMWNKYTRLYDINFLSSEYYGKRDSMDRLQTMCFDFFNWFDLYSGNLMYDPKYEQYADVELLS